MQLWVQCLGNKEFERDVGNDFLREVLSLYIFLRIREFMEREGMEENSITTFYSLHLPA